MHPLAGTSKQDGSPRINTKPLADYIIKKVSNRVSEANQSLIREALNNDVLETFANDPQSTVLVVNQFNDDQNDKQKVRYTVSNEIQASKDQTLCVSFIKKKPLPISDSPLLQQLFVTLFDGSDPYGSILAHIGKVMTPYSKSVADDIKELKLKFGNKKQSLLPCLHYVCVPFICGFYILVLINKFIFPIHEFLPFFTDCFIPAFIFSYVIFMFILVVILPPIFDKLGI